MKSFRNFARGLGLALLGVFCQPAGTGLAQGTAFTYQGQLQTGGSPANGLFDLRFTLYPAVTNGTPSGALTNAATPVTNGLFLATLDFGAVFTGSNCWLELAARTNGGATFTTLSPRQAVLPVPYAIYSAGAAVAASANSVAAASLVGTVPLAQLPGTVVTNGATGVTVSGSFTGNGAAVTNVNLFSLNTGGALAGTTNYTTNYSNFSFVLAASPVVGSYPVAVIAADINADGYPDLICANSGVTVGTLSILTNNGAGSFGSNATLTVGFNVGSVIAADVNGDGKPDLICANSGNNTLTVFTNNGTGIFGSNATLNTGSYPDSVIATDVNGDGHLDLVCANQNSYTLTVFTNNGTGGFGSNATLNAGNALSSVIAADVNGDGKPDLVCANNGSSTLVIFTNNGTGIFGSNAALPVVSGPLTVAAADVNGDGHVDLFSANNDHHVITVFTNNGSGIFSSNTTLIVAGYAADSVCAADFNGDGHVDLVCANYNENNLTVFTNNGSGGFGLSATLSTGNSPYSVITADLNGDGAPDLVCVNDGTNTLTVLTNASTLTPVPAGLTARFAGNGASLTGLNASQLTSGTVPLAQLPGTVLTNTENGVTLGGNFSGTLGGNGGGLTNLPAAAVTGGLTTNILTSSSGGHTLYITNGIIMRVQ